MAPSAPGRFSGTTGWPSAWESGDARMRPTTSSAPPGGKGITRRMGLLGYCAAEVVASSALRRPSRVRMAVMAPPVRNGQSIIAPSPASRVSEAIHVRFRTKAQEDRADFPGADRDYLHDLG